LIVEIPCKPRIVSEIKGTVSTVPVNTLQRFHISECSQLVTIPYNDMKLKWTQDKQRRFKKAVFVDTRRLGDSHQDATPVLMREDILDECLGVEIFFFFPGVARHVVQMKQL
jgi:hypothetical protein